MENYGSKLERIVRRAALIVVARKSGEGIVLNDAVGATVRVNVEVAILARQITNLTCAVAEIGVRALVLVASTVDCSAARTRPLSRGSATAQVGIVVAASMVRFTSAHGIFVFFAVALVPLDMEVISEVGNAVGGEKVAIGGVEVGQIVQVGQVGNPAHGSLIGDLQVEVSVRSKIGVL